jgi:hypothetical protein
MTVQRARISGTGRSKDAICKFPLSCPPIDSKELFLRIIFWNHSSITMHVAGLLTSANSHPCPKAAARTASLPLYFARARQTMCQTTPAVLLMDLRNAGVSRLDGEVCSSGLRPRGERLALTATASSNSAAISQAPLDSQNLDPSQYSPPRKVAVFIEPSPFSHVSGMKIRFQVGCPHYNVCMDSMVQEALPHN